MHYFRNLLKFVPANNCSPKVLDLWRYLLWQYSIVKETTLLSLSSCLSQPGSSLLILCAFWSSINACRGEKKIIILLSNVDLYLCLHFYHV